MERISRWIGIALTSWLMASCAQPPPPDTAVPGNVTRQIVAERVCAVIVTKRDNLGSWLAGGLSVHKAPRDADGGSAAPISPDGYFITADHVLAREKGRKVFLIFGQGHHKLQAMQARVVWRSASADLALVHVEKKTPYFYHWTPPEKWVPVGTMVIHGGISTGFKKTSGRTGTALSPERALTGTRRFKIDIPLQPGDSGGPVVDAYGRLIGINSAVEFLVPMETAFFVDSEASRPNISSIEAIIQADRLNQQRP